LNYYLRVSGAPNFITYWEIDMAGHRNKYSQRNWVGFLLIIIGILFILETFDFLDFGYAFARWWPLILIVIGFLKLKGREKPWGAIMLGIGIVFLLANLDIIGWGDIWRLWPLVLILVGLSMVMRSRRQSRFWRLRAEGETSADFVRASAIFGGNEQRVVSTDFKGGDIMALFGGVELDLRQAKASSEGCTLNLTSLFGGIEILVPPNWDLVVTGTPIFGGIESRESVIDTKKKLDRVVFRCTVAFGGIEIK
jgi:predicted membrane protein